MRIGEVTKCLRRSLILPADVGFTQTFILVQVEEPKTRNKGPRHQAAKVEAQDLVQVVSVAFEKLSASEKLWPLSPQTLRKRLDLLLSQIGASPPPRGTRALDLGSFRAGGATYLLQQTQDSELVRRRGRWASARVMETYLQEIAAVTYLPAVPAGQKARIFAISAGFSSVLRQVIKWTNAAVQSSVWYKL